MVCFSPKKGYICIRTKDEYQLIIHQKPFTMLYQKSTLRILRLVVFSLLLSQLSFGQTGVYDLQFANVTVDCEAETLCFDIEIKANAPGTEFFFGNSNIRFGFSSNLANPSIEQELELSGFVSGPGPAGFTLYGHNLNGSLDTVVSYNISATGDGVYIESTDYVGIGRVCVDILDFDMPVTLMFNMEATFPPTFISELPDFTPVAEGTFNNYEQDISTACVVIPPPDEVPTLGEWGLIVLTLLMLITAVTGIRQRDVSRSEMV